MTRPLWLLIAAAGLIAVSASVVALVWAPGEDAVRCLLLSGIITAFGCARASEEGSGGEP
ncbi:hypothetical protein [Nonomuraea recticatena]|uniref:Uncharacterized protein n=1 Tax=Nonomuraea recticatena TaxID=46178 RepID=A0ABP6G0H3_9ACTN